MLVDKKEEGLVKGVRTNVNKVVLFYPLTMRMNRILT